MFIRLLTLSLPVIAAFAPAAADEPTKLLRQPTISADHLAFIYAGDLWVSGHDGDDPRRLTTSPAEENNPYFSPDGAHIAFAADYEGNTDVYVIPIEGGQPQRLTWHPGDDIPVGWSADGGAVAFASERETDHGRSAQLWHVPRDGGAPVKQMDARFFRGRWDSEGRRLAYIDHGPAYNGLYGGSAGWRGYRGGTSPSVRILDPEAGEVQAIDGERVNDIQPFWMGNRVVFISDREDKRFDLHVFDPDTGAIEQLTDQDDWDIRWADGRDGRIVYEAGGQLHLLDLEDGDTQTLDIVLNPDLPQRRARWKDVKDNIQEARLSPNGKRALISARGEIFTVPVEHGSTRNLTLTDGQREYPALWSPEGDQIAWIVESREGQELIIADQYGEEKQRYELGPDFYRLHAWDAEQNRIAYTDNGLGLFTIDTADGSRREIARSARLSDFDVAFSPDGQWLAYTLNRPNYLNDLMLYQFAEDRSIRVSDGMADVSSPVFSRDGQYVYFAASTNAGPVQFGLDMSTQERPYRAGLYALVLAADGESPLAPRTGDEDVSDQDLEKNKGDEDEDEGEGENDDDNDDEDDAENSGDAPTDVRIDIDGLSERIVALPVAKGNYQGLAVAADGNLFWMRRAQPGSIIEPPGESTAKHHRLMRFDFEKRETSEALSNLIGFDMSATGSHLLIRRGGNTLLVAEAKETLEPEALDLSDLRLRIDPKSEWAQIFDEGWRMQREYFYASNLHGLDWDAVYERYRPLLDHVGRREDLNALMVEMIAEVQVGHNRTSGGDTHSESGPSGGLLGANFVIDQGRWRIARIYSGESWNSFLRGPLAQPGNEARVDEYILAVNGRELTSDDNLFAALHGTAGEQVRLTVGPNADGGEARDIVVEPVGSESQLRLWAWVEDNRREVNEATDGRVGYVYLPNTAGAGYTFFNRMFFAQLDKDALIIDERANGGGQAADYIVEVLSRPHLSNWVYRHGLMTRTPFGSLHGPKLMMIDQDAGSGGDYLPYSFRELEIGPLLGTRTWGGLIGIYANPPFVDGGVMTVPFFRFVDTENEWSVENEGVAPDIEVQLDPVATNEGRDTQLERAIEEIQRMLEGYKDEIPDEQPPLPTELGR